MQQPLCNEMLELLCFCIILGTAEQQAQKHLQLTLCKQDSSLSESDSGSESESRSDLS